MTLVRDVWADGRAGGAGRAVAALPWVLLVVAAMAGVTGAGVQPASAAPAPSPSASTPSSCPAPNTYLNGEGGVSGPAVNWCLPWARHVSGQGWLTVCSKAVSADEQDKCDAVSLTLDSPPRDNSRSVLADRPPGAAGNSAGSVVQCEAFGERADDDQANASRWLGKQQRCAQVRAFLVERSSARSSAGCGLDVSCRVTEGVEKAVRSGFEGLVDLTVKGFAWALSRLAEVVFEATTATADDPFYMVYNDIAGVLVILVLLYFIYSTAVSALRTGGPGPIASLLGLVRAMLGITFAGGIAFTLVAAWDEATRVLVERNASRDWQPGAWVSAVQSLTPDPATILLAFVVALFSLLGLVLLFLMLLFRSLLAVGAALFGGVAMAGQAMHGMRHHARVWFWTVNALASSKFFIAALWIYGSRMTYSADGAMNSLRGLLIIWLMVLAPGVLLRMTTIWDGYIADVNAGRMFGAMTTAVGLDAVLDRIPGGGAPDPAGLMDPDIPTTPAAAAGLTDGAAHDAAEAARQSPDGEPVGTPTTPAGDEPSAEAGDANAEEVDGVQRDTDTAASGVASGSLKAPGDATGVGSSVPVSPSAAQGQVVPDDGSSPAGQPSADAGGRPGSGVGASTTLPGSGAKPGGTAPVGSDGEEPRGGAPTSGGQGGAGGTGSAAAGGAADVPIVPV